MSNKIKAIGIASVFVSLLVFIGGTSQGKGVNQGAGFNNRDSLITDSNYLNIAVGELEFNIDAGSNYANSNYVLLGSADPNGIIPLPGGLNLDFGWDPVTDVIYQLLNTPFFANFQGTLDGDGQATATISDIGSYIPKESAGIKLYFQFCTFDPFGFVSNRVEIELIYETGKYGMIVCGNDVNPGGQQPDFEAAADYVYNMLISHNYEDDQIFYVHPKTGVTGVDYSLTYNNILQSFIDICDAVDYDVYNQRIISEDIEIFVYFVGHGDKKYYSGVPHGLYLFDEDSIGGVGGNYEHLVHKTFYTGVYPEFKGMYDLNNKIGDGGQILSVMEFCHSGFFADGDQCYWDTIQISSTDRNNVANGHPNQVFPAFSWVFLPLLNGGNSVEYSFDQAWNQIDYWNSNPPPGWAFQNPKIADEEPWNDMFL